MVVQHNLTAMNANRQLSGVHSRSQQRSYHLVTELTELVMMLQVFQFQRR